MATFSHRFDADHRTLSTFRGALLEWLDLERTAIPLAAPAAGDIDLVITELAANVIDHSRSPWVQVVVTPTKSGLTIEVSQHGDAGGLPDLESWGTAEDGDRGRGLSIVRALCDEIVIIRDHEAATIRCSMLN